MSTSRREFLEHIAQLALVPMVGGLAGCGGMIEVTGEAVVDGGPVACSAITPSVGSNHGHLVVVSLADVRARRNKTYTLSTAGSHTHAVPVTAAQFDTLAGGGVVVVESSEVNSHTHTVTLTCVALSNPDSGIDAGNDAGNAPSDAGGDAPFVCTTVTPTIFSNHGHTLTVPAADVAAGTTKTYALSNVGHTHNVTVTASHFAMLAAGTPAMNIVTTVSGHTHTITLTCS